MYVYLVQQCIFCAMIRGLYFDMGNLFVHKSIVKLFFFSQISYKNLFIDIICDTPCLQFFSFHVAGKKYFELIILTMSSL